MKTRRRKSEDTHDNHERWIVSYADFITLLFAFFVVMYALSTVNEGKYRVLSNSMTQAFRNIQVNTASTVPVMAPPPIPMLNKRNPAQQNQAARQAEAERQQVEAERQRAEAERQKRRDTMRDVARELMQVMRPLIDQGKVRVVETSRGVTIEINDSILFSSGHSVLEAASARAMQAIAQVLVPTDFPITIEGHTDNTPISTAQFPSNWELSAIRATTVLRLFADSGITPDRLTAIGYADTRPVEPNTQIEGRARNRRVTILIDSMAAEQGKEVDVNDAPEAAPTSQ